MSRVYRREIAARVGKVVGQSTERVDEIVRLSLDAIQQAVADGHDVQLAGFGKLSPVKTAERSCVNPQTGDSMIVPANRVPRFRAAVAFRRAVSNR